ncbi:MAG: hypothetical protein HY295_02305 [Thaumarchaeota archaeon]|nr:hypothetical protein [Nitrososphaerota archaeon]
MFRIRRFNKLRYKYYNDHTIDPDTNQEKVVARPKIEVAFRKSSARKDLETNPEIRVYGLMDSGADITFIPRQIAEILKIDLDEKTKRSSKSASESFVTYRANPYLEIIYEGTRIPIGEIETAIPEKYAPDKDIEKMILLGRNSIFTKYVVTFNEQARAMEFRLIQEKQNFKGLKK